MDILKHLKTFVFMNGKVVRCETAAYVAMNPVKDGEIIGPLKKKENTKGRGARKISKKIGRIKELIVNATINEFVRRIFWVLVKEMK